MLSIIGQVFELKLLLFLQYISNPNLQNFISLSGMSMPSSNGQPCSFSDLSLRDKVWFESILEYKEDLNQIFFPFS